MHFSFANKSQSDTANIHMHGDPFIFLNQNLDI